MRKLKDTGQGIERYFERARTLGDKLRIVVFQLPPRWRCNAERLDAFLAAVRRGGLRRALARKLDGWRREGRERFLR